MRQRIEAIIGEEVDAGTGQTRFIAEHIVRELRGTELEQIVSDWLEGKARIL